MGILSSLSPREVFGFFEEICAIPHGSGNTKQISRYLAEFAKKRSLKYRQDELGNVIIWKKASQGYEDREPIMLQGHMDMVAVKKPQSTINMEKEGLRLAVEGDTLFARETSLGGDDGIALAYELALLDTDTLPHPPLECVFTVDEEIGLLGAQAIDLSDCLSQRLINLDSEEEGIFLAGCAGGMRVDCHLPWQREEVQGICCTVRIGGLLGGHSGAEIHRGRANSNVLAGRFLLYAKEKVTLRLVDIEGGLADNAIPRETAMKLLVADPFGLVQAAEEFDRMLKLEYAAKDPGIFCCLEQHEPGSYFAVTREDTLKAATLIGCLPNGVQSYSGEIEGLVETSLNMGLLNSSKEGLSLGFSLRSSFESAKNGLKQQLFALTESLGGSSQATGDYPGWAYRKDSPLREKMAEVYEKMYGRQPEIQAIHAGLECGFFQEKIPQLDCVSIGPDMKDIHTTEETMSISSVCRTWEFLCQVLREV
ncbi:MAG: aminoacyl-histidine dipeptidase [Lachnospiraceae bacterium]|nr:aminoacyl-histidine dipeptidase [Lachnospiraceae bacterium]